MRPLYLDLETYSPLPITVGTHRYAEAAEVLLMAWAFGDDAVQVTEIAGRAPLAGMLGKLLGSADKAVIHNSAFDRAVLAAHGVDLPARLVHDTMVQALAHSLPGSLGSLCDVLGIPVDKAKDREGKKLIALFCQPLPKNRKLRRATRETHPAEWSAFVDYARRDVEAMRAVHKKLPNWNNIDIERDLWLLDQRINQRGVKIDTRLADAAIAAVEREQRRLAAATSRATLGLVGAATQRDALLDYLREAYDCRLPDLQGATVERFLQRPDVPPDVRDLLALRQQTATASTAKYRALKRAVSGDGRLRGCLQFCGASRTGRWAGRLFQPQNLPRPTLKNEQIDAGIAALKEGRESETPIMELASSALRGLIVAAPAHKLVVADLSNIEGRVLAWLAGEQWKLDAFAAYDRGEGPDLYKLAYAKSFGVAVDAVTDDQRQVGKVQELALGYEGGVGAFVTFAAGYGLNLDALAARAMPALPADIVDESADAWAWMKGEKRPTFGLARETWVAADGVKRAWRRAHPAIARFWSELRTAFQEALDSPGRAVAVGRILVIRNGAWLRIVLPSGRSLCYPSPREHRDDNSLSYQGVDPYTRKWGRLKTYGGKLAENATQAVARDVLAHGMLSAEFEGYRIVLTVHDEIVAEVADRDLRSAKGLVACMSDTPSWAEGLPLAAKGFETYRYRKG